jgi:hypothetical protein
VVLTLIGEWLLVPSHSGLGVALGAWLAIVFVLGPLARLVWPWARDVAYLRGAIGWCADLPSLLAFLGPLGSNPHGGYFHFGGEARRQIAALLRSEGAAASVQPGEPALEADGRIRWKRVYISV